MWFQTISSLFQKLRARCAELFQSSLHAIAGQGGISYTSITYRALTYLFNFFSEIKWPRIQAFINGGVYYKLKEQDHEKLRGLLAPNYYFIVTRRNSHLTTYLIQLASLIATGKNAHYTHALMNVDDGNIKNDDDFKLIEATSAGVHFSTFMQVFDCDSVALLKPRGVMDSEWTAIIDEALSNKGKGYDNLFNLLEDNHMSCVELCYDVLKRVPDYQNRFVIFEDQLKKMGYKLTPHMLYDCKDFEVVFEIRR